MDPINNNNIPDLPPQNSETPPLPGPPPINDQEEASLKQQYQDILDKYARELMNNPTPPEDAIPAKTITPEPDFSHSLPPEFTNFSPSTEAASLPPEPLIPSQPEVLTPVSPEPLISPQPQPFTPIPPEPVAPPNFEPMPPSQLPPIPPVAMIAPPPAKSGGFFKFFFYLSLIIFLAVFATLGYTFYKNSRPMSNSDANIVPTLIPVAAGTCQVNDTTYGVGDTFSSDGSCNICTCQADSTISCTEIDCSLMPTASTSASMENIEKYNNSVFGISFEYPKEFVLTDELPKTKSSTGPKNSLTLTDANKNTIGIVVDPAGFGPIFADKKVDLTYTEAKGLIPDKTTPAESQENLDPLKTIVWYQFDTNTHSNLTIITSSVKTDTTFESKVNQILSSFKFL